MSAYSFLNVSCSINGPGGSFPIGAGVGSAKEGITVAMDEDKTNTMTGADGKLMHSLHGGNTGTITVRLLKTSPTNRLLSLLYNAQRASSALWGQNVLNVNDALRGDIVVGTQMAFIKQPDMTWAEDGNAVEWTFRGIVNELLGDGQAIAA